MLEEDFWFCPQLSLSLYEPDRYYEKEGPRKEKAAHVGNGESGFPHCIFMKNNETM